MITYDVPAVADTGHPTVVPVVIMDARGATVDPLAGAGTEVTALNPLLTVTDPTS